jgi:hypothetical protein
MKVQLARQVWLGDEFAEVVCATDWLHDMPVPVAGDVLMDGQGNWSTVLRRVFLDDPPKVILWLTNIEADIEDWLTFHPGWARRGAP